jgi:hypothetical protein
MSDFKVFTCFNDCKMSWMPTNLFALKLYLGYDKS